MVKDFASWFHSMVHSPKKVLIICAILALGTLLADGTLIQLWNLKQEKAKLETNLVDVDHKTKQVIQKIRMANDPRFIEREARDRFDLVEDGDMVFVFSGE